MRTRTTTTLIALALATLAAPAAFAQASTAPAAPAGAETYHYWLHPKLGMVKVDKKTHFMLGGGRASRQASTTSPAFIG